MEPKTVRRRRRATLVGDEPEELKEKQDEDDPPKDEEEDDNGSAAERALTSADRRKQRNRKRKDQAVAYLAALRSITSPSVVDVLVGIDMSSTSPGMTIIDRRQPSLLRVRMVAFGKPRQMAAAVAHQLDRPRRIQLVVDPPVQTTATRQRKRRRTIPAIGTTTTTTATTNAPEEAEFRITLVARPHPRRLIVPVPAIVPAPTSASSGPPGAPPPGGPALAPSLPDEDDSNSSSDEDEKETDASANVTLERFAQRAARCEILTAALMNVLDEYRPVAGRVAVAIEAYTFRIQGSSSISSLCETGGVIRNKLHRAGFRFFEVSPTAVKSWFTNRGDATKPQMWQRFGVVTNGQLPLDQWIPGSFRNGKIPSPHQDLVDSFASAFSLHRQLL